MYSFIHSLIHSVNHSFIHLHTFYTVDIFFSGLDAQIVIYNTGSNQLHFLKWDDYQKKKKLTQSVDIFPADQTEHYTCRVAATTSGVVCCIYYGPANKEEPQNNMATLRTYDITSGSELNVWEEKMNVGDPTGEHARNDQLLHGVRLIV